MKPWPNFAIVLTVKYLIFYLSKYRHRCLQAESYKTALPTRMLILLTERNLYLRCPWFLSLCDKGSIVAPQFSVVICEAVNIVIRSYASWTVSWRLTPVDHAVPTHIVFIAPIYAQGAPISDIRCCSSKNFYDADGLRSSLSISITLTIWSFVTKAYIVTIIWPRRICEKL